MLTYSESLAYLHAIYCALYAQPVPDLQAYLTTQINDMSLDLSRSISQVIGGAHRLPLLSRSLPPHVLRRKMNRPPCSTRPREVNRLTR